jgi:hypothetical protein
MKHKSTKKAKQGLHIEEEEKRNRWKVAAVVASRRRWVVC